MENIRYIRTKRIDIDGSGSIQKVVDSTELTDAPFVNPSGFLEKIEYSEEVPYSIVKQVYHRPGISSLHYADTLEVMIFINMYGSVTLYGRSIELQGRPLVFIVLPDIVHATELSATDEGYELNLKFSLDEMKKYLGIENLLKMNGHSLKDLAASVPDFDEVFRTVNELIRCDNENIFCRMTLCMKLFELFDRGIRHVNESFSESNLTENKDLNRLIRWTSSHFREPITLDDAAATVGMSKFYFCKFFKKYTDMTYLQYILKLRIGYAQKLLMNGTSTADCCYECGFESVPYFTQLFKKHTGYTTGEYRQLFSTELRNKAKTK